jgi:hypothetical protein
MAPYDFQKEEDTMDYEKEYQKEKEEHDKTKDLLRASNLLLEKERQLNSKLEKQVADLHRELAGVDDKDKTKKVVTKPNFKEMFR